MSKQLPSSGRGQDLAALLRTKHQGSNGKRAEPAVVDPFAPQPIDPSTVTGTAEEQLAAFEAAMDRAKETAGHTLRASRARFVVEAGTALREIRDRDGGLYKGTYNTFGEYVKSRWEMDRTRAYQLIDSAPTMLVMSKIFDKGPVESHAPVIRPILEQHGEEAVKEIVTAIRTAGEKVTAQGLRDHAERLRYATVPVQSSVEKADEQDQEGTGDRDMSPNQARDLVRLEQGVAALRGAHRALRGRVVPNAVAADRVRANELLDEMIGIAEKIVKLSE